MNSLVIELQKDLYDSESKVTDILRKAYILASKLNIPDFKIWINNELNGYNDYEIIPDYRKVQGDLKGLNPYRGWIPVMIPDSKNEEILKTRKLGESIPELENLVNNSKDSLYIMLPDNFSKYLNFPTKVRFNIGQSQIVSIIEKVKNIILEWSLKLEEDKILGENMTFSKEEKETAADKNYTVNHFYGNISESQFQQNTQNSTQTYNQNHFDPEALKLLITKINDQIDNIGLTTDDKEKIQNEIDTIKNQISHSNPDKTLIDKGLESIKRIVEGVASNLIASGIIYEISQWLQ